MTSTAKAQDTCSTLSPGPTISEDTGCFPLTYHPADGSPDRTVWVHSTYVPPIIGPTQSHGKPYSAALKNGELDLGASAFYTRPDYAQSINVDVGVFVAYTFKYIGVEVDAADTVVAARNIHEPYLVAGPRLQYRKRYFTLYGKAQVGAAHFSGAPVGALNNKQTFFIENYGAGLELRIARNLKLRVVDANYQIYPNFAPRSLSPLRIGSGFVFTL